jgi:hypothetical protein
MSIETSHKMVDGYYTELDAKVVDCVSSVYKGRKLRVVKKPHESCSPLHSFYTSSSIVCVFPFYLVA